MINARPPLALIAGPTASGKSALALELAVQRNGVIINADSAQLYRDLPILSAAPSAEDFATADHRLYGTRDGADPCSAADWAAMARAEIAGVHAAGRLPILVGGTGLYLRTLLDGIAPVPPIAPAVREAVRGLSQFECYTALLTEDAGAAARIAPADTARAARALEVVRSSGRTLTDWQDERSGGIGDAVDLRAVILLPERAALYGRCDARFAVMIEGGAIDEVAALLARGLDPALPVMRAIGVREIAAMLRGELSREEVLVAGQQATRNYAKRQYTWLRHQPPADWHRCDIESCTTDAVIDFLLQY